MTKSNKNYFFIYLGSLSALFGEASCHRSVKTLYLGACKSLQNFSLFHPKIALA